MIGFEHKHPLQYADAKAHKPDKVEKRISFLDEIDRRLKVIMQEKMHDERH